MLARVVFLFVCLPAVAAADPAAEALFQDGRNALAAGKLDEACDLFKRSDVIEPRVGTVLNLADCEQRRGHVASAWSDFVDAEARANRTGDPRASEAARRAGSLVARLPHLTIAVPAATRVPGLTVHRNGAVVDAAEWDRKLPFDPGTYRLDVDATGYATWHRDVTLVEGKEVRVEIPALVAVAESPHDLPHDVAPPPVDRPPPVAAAPASSSAYHIGIGVLTGLSSDNDWINGGRLVLDVAPLGPGVVRVVPSVMYASSTDAADPYHLYTTYAFGLTLEYAYSLTDRLVAAGGVGAGLDRFKDNYSNGPTTNGWGAVRLSPTVRFDRLDVGGHVQFVFVSGRVVTLFELGLDFFVW